MMGAMFASVRPTAPAAAAAAVAATAPPQSHRGRFRLLLLSLAAVLAVCGLTLALSSPAGAHSELASSAPVDGAALSSPPAAVTLTFNETIMDAGLQVVASGPTGTIPLDTPVITGPTLTVAWPSNAPDGDYQVAYRVVSADGHPIDGSIRFSYTGGSGTSDSLGQGQSAAANATPAPAGPTSDAPFTWWAGVLVVLAGVSIGAGIAYYLRYRNRTAGVDH